MSDLHPVRRALLSVSDKTGLVDLGKSLYARGIELLSTGGTAHALREAGLGTLIAYMPEVAFEQDGIALFERDVMAALA